MSSADTPKLPLNAYGAAWGPPLIATFIAAMFISCPLLSTVYAPPPLPYDTSVYGISVLQTFYYYSRHGKRDGLGWLTLVAVILWAPYGRDHEPMTDDSVEVCWIALPRACCTARITTRSCPGACRTWTSSEFYSTRS